MSRSWKPQDRSNLKMPVTRTPSSKNPQPSGSRTSQATTSRSAPPSRTPQPPGSRSAPPSRTPQTPGSRSAPPSRTPQSSGSRTVPPSRTPQSSGSRTVPPSRTPQSSGSRTVPPSRTPQPSGSRGVPPSRAPQPSGSRGVPTSRTPQVSSSRTPNPSRPGPGRVSQHQRTPQAPCLPTQLQASQRSGGRSAPGTAPKVLQARGQHVHGTPSQPQHPLRKLAIHIDLYMECYEEPLSLVQVRSVDGEKKFAYCWFVFVIQCYGRTTNIF